MQWLRTVILLVKHRIKRNVYSRYFRKPVAPSRYSNSLNCDGVLLDDIPAFTL